MKHLPIRVAAIAVWAALAVACAAPVERAPADLAWEGTLRSGVVAIGGETTGWVLERPGARTMEVDVSAVTERAHRLDGRRVRITGRLTEREYVERGSVPVLVAASLEAVARAAA